MVMTMLSGKAVLVTATAFLALVPAGGAGAAAKKKTTPQVKVFPGKVVTRTVPELGSAGGFFQRSQLVNASCGRRYLPLAIGIVSATNPLAGQDLGWAGMSVYASGAKGQAQTKLQALCVRGGREPYYTGRQVKFKATGAGYFATAELSCKTGYVALGAALAHGHAPAFGGYVSMPNGARRWSYSATITNSIYGQYYKAQGQLGYPRTACVRATGVTTAEFSGTVTPTAPAQGTATCKKGRALGWGVDLSRPHRDRVGANGYWTIPTVQRAEFTGARSMAFSFSRSDDPGGGYNYDVPVRAVVVCGTLPKG